MVGIEVATLVLRSQNGEDDYVDEDAGHENASNLSGIRTVWNFVLGERVDLHDFAVLESFDDLAVHCDRWQWEAFADCCLDG